MAVLAEPQRGLYIGGLVLSRSSDQAAQLASRWAGSAIGLGALAAMVGLDVALGSETAVVGVFAVAPFLAAAAGGPRETAVVAVVVPLRIPGGAGDTADEGFGLT